ncbi:hypothetical protein Q8A73_022180 [Channa argus]|nr:hypothetical protein Q8A73_022180 [Channa argus]
MASLDKDLYKPGSEMLRGDSQLGRETGHIGSYYEKSLNNTAASRRLSPENPLLTGTHTKQQSMRCLCKEEDYAFLGTEDKMIKEVEEGAGVLEDNWRDKKEDRDRRRLEREQEEKERLREIEKCKKEKEQQWRTHVAERTSMQEKAVQDRLARIRKFREFQRKVLAEESGLESEAVGLTVNQLLTRM